MKLETFFEQFDQLADAPNAAAKMRALVLQLAVTGKLVLQDKRDWPASSLLDSVRAQRANLVAARRIKPRSTATVEADEHLFELPSNWAWARLSDVCHELGQKVPENRFTYIHVGSIDSDKGCISDRVEQLDPHEAPSRARKLVARGTVIYSTVRPYLLNVAIIDRDFDPEPIASTAFGVLHPFSGIDNRYVFYWLRSAPFNTYVHGVMKGVAYPAINDEKLYSGLIALPPLAEQKRIVARVDELMALCDRLEAQQLERVTRDAALARAALARFADTPTPANLNLLFQPSYTTPSADLRKSILTLAVKGRLVFQDPNDESLEATLPKLASVALEHRDNGLPLHWLRVPLGRTGEWRGGGTPSKSRPELWNGNIPWVSPKDMKALHISDARDHISKSALEGSSVRIIPPGSLLMVVRGMILARAFPVALTTREVTINQDMKALLPFEPQIKEYLLVALRALESEVLTAIEHSTHGTCKLEMRFLHSVTIPIPPLAEQRRIVAKVNQLMALVDQLETQLLASRANSEQLLEALIAELTGTEFRSGQNKSLQHTVFMKERGDTATERRTDVNPLKMSTRRFVLRRFAMTSGYRSLGKFDCSFHPGKADANEASPVCLVGLNGSGKSNLIEAIAEVFCFLELINLPWKKVASASSRYRENRHRFELEYILQDSRGERLVRVRKLKKNGAEFFIVKDDGSEEAVEPGTSQLLLLPRRIIGYSSGLNETVSHPFLRTKTIYSEEVRDAAPQEGIAPSKANSVFDTRTLYMDYESNAAIIISNYIFRKQEELAIFDKTRVRGVSSFGLHFNRKRANRSGANKIVRLTGELQSYLQSFARCAGANYDGTQISHDFDFQLTSRTKALFRREFKTAEKLFMAMHKWSLLNALILSDEQRNVYLSSDITKGALERPPSVPPSDRVFNIVDLKLSLSEPAIEIDYSGLSDGEHQFIQVFGTTLLFSEPGTLLLFDEPESHFNPEWRTQFNLILNGLPNASRQEYMISTHSPYIVSGSKMSNVYKFTRTGGDITFGQVDFETYGASFDVLLKKLFSIDSFIDQSAKKDMEQIIKRGRVKEMQEAVGDFAESKEKRRLYEALIKKEGVK